MPFPCLPFRFHSTRKVSRAEQAKLYPQFYTGFHSTRKVSRDGKGVAGAEDGHVSIPLGRFQGCANSFVNILQFQVSIPLGRFQGRASSIRAFGSSAVSIPLGRFQGSQGRAWVANVASVSIPLGRFQGSFPSLGFVAPNGFHSTRKVSREGKPLTQQQAIRFPFH